MEHLISAGVAVASAALIVGVFALLKHFKVKAGNIVKPCGAILFVTAFLRYLYRKPAIYDMKGLDDLLSPFNTAESVNVGLTLFAILLVWFSYAAILTTVMSAFFNYRTLRRLANLFALPMFAVLLGFYGTYAVATFGAEGFIMSDFRFWVMPVEIGLGIAIIACNNIEDKKFDLPASLKDVGNFFYGLVFSIIAIMPCYVPQAFFRGLDGSVVLEDLTPEHRIMLYLSVLIPVIIFQLLKNKTPEVNRCILTYMSLAFFWVYIGRWELHEFADPRSLPLHLCNTAMFLYPICLVFNTKKLFNFCLFINIIGAFLAMCMPNTSSSINAIGTERVSYWLNHYAAFFMPVLMVALKVFKRPKFKQWIYAIVTLVIYYAAMLFTNAYLSATGEATDYFFTNSDFIVSNLGKWAERTREYTVTIDFAGAQMVFYPIYQVIFIATYVVLSVAIWFLFGMLFNALDAEEDRRKRAKDYKRMKKDLKKYLGENPETAEKGDNAPSLVIRNFSKRYGSNKHYSVKDVSFEVNGGEIFGFLGPNGAGKSTIIKSMVGIQTITEGNIEICGYDVEKQSVSAKLNTAFVPDHYALYENLTGREYINYIADLYQVSKEERDEIIDKYVEAFQLTGAFDNQMKTYSHGMKQKITIMSALVHNPKVWILDEPLTGLDPTSIHEVKECMKEHAAKGNIVFFSSHIIDVVEKLCDKIAIIKKGQLRAYTSLKDLAEQGIELEQYYLDIIYDGNDEHVPYVEAEEETAE